MQKGILPRKTSTIECQTDLQMDTIFRYEQQMVPDRLETPNIIKKENVSTVGQKTTLEGVTDKREKSNFGQIFHASKEFPQQHFMVDQSITFTEIKANDLRKNDDTPRIITQQNFNEMKKETRDASVHVELKKYAMLKTLQPQNKLLAEQEHKSSDEALAKQNSV